ncbi:Flagellum-specific ATP synthase FliI [Liberibacter crescens BT-1]|uniref:Flagellum-specific ATP synthase FliI n=1 Tax=Liberibacter crescens (strain BT-1) TaxID=1215343 RepID=L0ETM3_LIBCB|nr:FliI/YscN family ATPase [Liberibacter crescens]AGA64180.1 Flagellum-specific ATP synthase FliI [Liberibacter crescens BT-1]AMC12442.1 ATP synthase [Liberibacter crescens]
MPKGKLNQLARLTEEYAQKVLIHGGYVRSILSGYYTVSGLSKHVCLGDFVVHKGREFNNLGQVMRVELDFICVCPLEVSKPISLGDLVLFQGPFKIAPTSSWCGRVINALGEAIDGRPALEKGRSIMSISSNAPLSMNRQRVERGFKTGIRVIDIFTPFCHGQRLGVFSGSGVGKSTLLSMLVHVNTFDKIVIALVGERGREVREFIEDVLGNDLENFVIVVATGDESPILRRMAPLTSVTIAEYFCSQGDNVLLIIDSITRFSHAIRELAMSSGELPVARGYPPSVFTELSRLLERTGPGIEGKGNITAIVSILVDGDNHNDPISDSVRGILDGHIVLKRSLAEEGRYPPVDPLASISRLAHKVWNLEESQLVSRLKLLISRFEETRDFRLVGGYRSGVDLDLDIAVQQVPVIYEFLKQLPNQDLSSDAFSDMAMILKAQ